MKNILVLGGAGFIGGHLCRTLLERGHQVTAVSSSQAGAKKLEALRAFAHFDFFAHDIREPFKSDAQEIYHLASPASPADCARDPVKTLTTNIQGSINALDVARHSGAKILFSSTSEIYGNPTVTPQAETLDGTVDLKSPRASYCESKRCAEAMFLEQHQLHHIPVKIVRLFNTYGPGIDLRDGRVMSNFILQAMSGEPLTLYGEGTQKRSFCYISDMVDGIIRAMESPDGFTGPVNLGAPATAVTMLELAELVKAAARSRSEIIRKPGHGSGIDLIPDITLAQTALGWTPIVGLREGLEKTIAAARA